MANQNSIHCPDCRIHTNLIRLTSYSMHSIEECNGCSRVFLVTRDIHHGNIVETHPNALPKPINEKTPDFLKSDMEEAYKCFSVGAYRATGVMARRTLQLCCIDKGSPKKSLKEQIDWLLEKQIITKDLKDCAHEVRLTGNDAAHPPEDIEKDNRVSKEDADDIVSLLEQFISVLYIAPALSEERRQKRNNDTSNG